MTQTAHGASQRREKGPRFELQPSRPPRRLHAGPRGHPAGRRRDPHPALQDRLRQGGRSLRHDERLDRPRRQRPAAVWSRFCIRRARWLLARRWRAFPTVDEYDIDVIADLDIRHDTNPQLVLDTLFNAIRGERGSRYWGKAVRHARCVCVSYEDGMHIDLTPAVHLPGLPDRTSVIFHSKPEDPAVPDQHLWANPWGLADWFNSHTRIEADFAKFFAERADDYAQHIRRPRAGRGCPRPETRGSRNPEPSLRCN